MFLRDRSLARFPRCTRANVAVISTAYLDRELDAVRQRFRFRSSTCMRPQTARTWLRTSPPDDVRAIDEHAG
jgi:hypothetical protein